MSNLAQNERQVELIKRKEKTIYDLIAQNMKSIQSQLPKHITAERMARLCFSTIVRTPQLLNAEASSLLACILEASAIGLEPDPRWLVYFVPYKGKLQVIIGYRGYMELAYRSDKVSQIFAETVHKNDKFEFCLGLEPKLIHVPSLEDRGELFAVYAVAKMKDGTSNFVVLGENEISKSRNASQSANGKGAEYSPWNTYTEEMWKKTSIKKLCKYLPLSVDIQNANSLELRSEQGEVFDIDFMDIDKKKQLNLDMKQIAHDIESEEQKGNNGKTSPQQKEEDLQVAFDMLLSDNNISSENGYKFVEEWAKAEKKDVNEVYKYALANKKTFLSSFSSWEKDVQGEQKEKQNTLM